MAAGIHPETPLIPLPGGGTHSPSPAWDNPSQSLRGAVPVTRFTRFPPVPAAFVPTQPLGLHRPIGYCRSEGNESAARTSSSLFWVLHLSLSLVRPPPPRGPFDRSKMSRSFQTTTNSTSTSSCRRGRAWGRRGGCRREPGPCRAQQGLSGRWWGTQMARGRGDVAAALPPPVLLMLLLC